MEINWTEVIVTLISLVLVPLISWALTELGKYIAAKTAAIKDEAARAYVRNAVERAEDAVRLAVRETAQTFVDSLKKAGTFDEAAAKSAFNQSMTRAKQILGAEGRAMLADATEDVEAWLTARIEASVKSVIY